MTAPTERTEPTAKAVAKAVAKDLEKTAVDVAEIAVNPISGITHVTEDVIQDIEEIAELARDDPHWLLDIWNAIMSACPCRNDDAVEEDLPARKTKADEREETDSKPDKPPKSKRNCRQHF